MEFLKKVNNKYIFDTERLEKSPYISIGEFEYFVLGVSDEYLVVIDMDPDDDTCGIEHLTPSMYLQLLKIAF